MYQKCWLYCDLPPYLCATVKQQMLWSLSISAFFFSSFIKNIIPFSNTNENLDNHCFATNSGVIGRSNSFTLVPRHTTNNTAISWISSLSYSSLYLLSCFRSAESLCHSWRRRRRLWERPARSNRQPDKQRQTHASARAPRASERRDGDKGGSRSRKETRRELWKRTHRDAQSEINIYIKNMLAASLTSAVECGVKIGKTLGCLVREKKNRYTNTAACSASWTVEISRSRQLIRQRSTTLFSVSVFVFICGLDVAIVAAATCATS